MNAEMHFSPFKLEVRILILPGDKYVDRAGKTIVYNGKEPSLLRSTCEKLPDDVLKSLQGDQMDQRLELEVSRASRQSYYLYLGGKDVQQLPSSWEYGENLQELFVKSNITLSKQGYFQHAKLLDAATVFIVGRFDRKYCPAGSVISSTGTDLTDREQKNVPVLVVNGEEKPRLSTIGEVVELLKKQS